MVQLSNKKGLIIDPIYRDLSSKFSNSVNIIVRKVFFFLNRSEICQKLIGYDISEF